MTTATTSSLRGVSHPCRSATLLLVLALLAPALWAQTGLTETVEQDLQISIDDAYDVFTAPARFDGEAWLYTALALGATAAAYTIDDDVYAELRSHAVEDWDVPLAAGQWYGSGFVSVALGAGLYFGGYAGGDDHTRITGRLVLQSFVYSVTITQILKVTMGRARPSTGRGKDAFTWFSFEDNYNSFPSGHSTMAFALSATLSRRIGSLPLSIFLYGLATLTMTERIAHDRHWFSDSVLGAVIGSVVGIAVVRLEEARISGVRLSAPLQLGSYDETMPGRHRPLLVLSVGL
ncbi:MAG: phosphatase PAP2 family protein [Bacteroidetes bacterium]|nr:phosphatase PAP2 family protein [Bacteroidota bacterium]